MSEDHERYADPNYRFGSDSWGKGPLADLERCRWEVADHSLRFPHYSQCSRKAVVDGLWCRQHSPEATEQRRKKTEERETAQWNARLMELYSRKMYEALEEIASGQLNDPAGYADMKLDEFGLRRKK